MAAILYRGDELIGRSEKLIVNPNTNILFKKMH